MKAASLLLAASLLTEPALAASRYLPSYGGSDGSLLEFKNGGFFVTYFDDEGDYSYDCKMIESLTSSVHWAQCKGGEKFLYTLDPTNPLTMKIGDVTYTECSKLDDC